MSSSQDMQRDDSRIAYVSIKADEASDKWRDDASIGMIVQIA